MKEWLISTAWALFFFAVGISALASGWLLAAEWPLGFLLLGTTWVFVVLVLGIHNSRAKWQHRSTTTR